MSTTNVETPRRAPFDVGAVTEHTLRSGLWISGVALIAFGVAAMLRAGTGMGSFDVVITGAAERTGLALWLAAVVANTIAVAAAVVLTRQVSAGTIIYMVGFGPVLGLAVAATEHVGGADVVWLAAGIVSIAAGSAVGITANYGPSPLDAFTCAVAGAIRRPLWQTRIGLEVALTAAGAAIGGIWGWGTLAAAVSVGVVFGVIHRGLEPVRDHLSARHPAGATT